MAGGATGVLISSVAGGATGVLISSVRRAGLGRARLVARARPARGEVVRMSGTAESQRRWFFSCSTKLIRWKSEFQKLNFNVEQLSQWKQFFFVNGSVYEPQKKYKLFIFCPITSRVSIGVNTS